MDPDKAEQCGAMIWDLHCLKENNGSLSPAQQLAYDLLLWMMGEGPKPNLQ